MPSFYAFLGCFYKLELGFAFHRRIKGPGWSGFRYEDCPRLVRSQYFTSSSRISQKTWSRVKSNAVVIIVPKVGINVRKSDINSSLGSGIFVRFWGISYPPFDTINFWQHDLHKHLSTKTKLFRSKHNSTEDLGVRGSDGGHPTFFPMVHGALVRKNIPCLKVVVMLVTCNGTIQNGPMVKSDFPLAVDYRDKQRLMRSKNFQNHLWSCISHSIWKSVWSSPSPWCPVLRQRHWLWLEDPTHLYEK